MGDLNFTLILPVICLAAYALLVLLWVPFMRGSSRALALISMIGIGMTGFVLFRLWKNIEIAGPQQTAYDLVRIDGIGLFFSVLILLVGALSVLASVPLLERERIDQGEFYALLLFCLAGMFLMVQTTNLMVILIGLEVFSLALYVMTGLSRGRVRSVEAALKYFLLGAFSSGFIVYGMALTYGVTGTLDLTDVAQAAAAGPSRMLLVGMGLLLVGLAFKIGVVPFHHWVPDVYEGAPTNVTGFMAAATKTAAIAVLLRFLIGAFGAQSEMWIPLITGLAIVTMTVANLVALAQNNLKRLLAFSSIAHAGYLLIAVTCNPESGVRAILFYLTVYGLMTVGAFAVLSAIGSGDEDSERGYMIQDWAGIGWRKPLLGLAMLVFLVSMAGIPPTGGFLGKYLVFQSAIESKRYMLAVIGMLNAAVAAYYYLRVIVYMFMREPEAGTEAELEPVSPLTATVMVVSIVAVIYLGLAPGRLLNIIQSLADALI